MLKDRILSEIKRTADENGGAPLGMVRFQKETGSTRDAWLGKFWRRWSEAVAEAGFTPNERTPAFESDHLLQLLAQATRTLRRFPIDADLSLMKVNDPSFPHRHRFRKLGSVPERVELLRDLAQKSEDYADLLPFLPESAPVEPKTTEDPAAGVDGAVYMLKLGRHYKIGKSFSVPRRHREIAIELPEKPDVVHVITTDDPAGIEGYWHKRFAAKRTNGEWFALTKDDVRAFKRRKLM